MNGKKEKAVWQSKELASKEAIIVWEQQYTSEIASLSENLVEYETNWGFGEGIAKFWRKGNKVRGKCCFRASVQCFKVKPSKANPCSNELQFSDDENKRSPEERQ
ncbi:hypothetical protein OROHE_007972 [Orobanche hederae]